MIFRDLEEHILNQRHTSVNALWIFRLIIKIDKLLYTMFSTLYCQDMCISPVNPFADTVVLYLKINMSTIDTMGAGY